MLYIWKELQNSVLSYNLHVLFKCIPVQLHCSILKISSFFFTDALFPKQVMTTLSTEEKEQFLSLKKRLKDLSKGS